MPRIISCPLPELNRKVGARIAELVGVPAAMVTCGAASAIIGGHHRLPHSRRREADFAPARYRGLALRGDPAEEAPLGLRTADAGHRRAHRVGGNARGGRARHKRPHGHDVLPQQGRARRRHQARRVDRHRQETRRPDFQRCRRRRSARFQSQRLRQARLRPGDLFRRQGPARPASHRIAIWAART